MSIEFTKMHGLGNDFVVFDAVNQHVALDENQLRAIADRRFGVGCDQILFVEPPRSPDTEFYYRIVNADGSEASPRYIAALETADFADIETFIAREGERHGRTLARPVLRASDGSARSNQCGTSSSKSPSSVKITMA